MLNISKHREVMLSILKTIYEDTLLGPVLGFKGGTLLYTMYNLPRFSVDLDFDLLDFTKKDEVLEKLGNILKKYGRVDQLKDKKYTLRGQQNLKIEISKRSIGSSYEIKSYLGVSILAMVKSDIFANKLMALVSRKKPANRDIFDTWFMLDNGWEANWKLVEEKTKTDEKTFLGKCINLLENWPLDSLLDGMGELIDNKTKDWVRKDLIKDTIFLLKVKLQG